MFKKFKDSLIHYCYMRKDEIMAGTRDQLGFNLWSDFVQAIDCAMCIIHRFMCSNQVGEGNFEIVEFKIGGTVGLTGSLNVKLPCAISTSSTLSATISLPSLSILAKFPHAEYTAFCLKFRIGRKATYIPPKYSPQWCEQVKIERKGAKGKREREK
jgi:hypothetical protein